MTGYTLTIPGDPVAKGRPRVFPGHGVTPRKTVLAENRIYAAFTTKYPNMEPIEGPIDVHVGFWLSRRGKPDLDNMVKLLLDALNKVAWRDDSQVTGIIAAKYTPDTLAPGTRPGTWRHRKTGDPLTTGGQPYQPHTYLEIIQTPEWDPTKEQTS